MNYELEAREWLADKLEDDYPATSEALREYGLNSEEQKIVDALSDFFRYLDLRNG